MCHTGVGVYGARILSVGREVLRGLLHFYAVQHPIQCSLDRNLETSKRTAQESIFYSV